MVKNLVVGYGNSLRSDDGIGIRIAEIVASWHLPEVRSLSCHQLTPELAADLAGVDMVIFVDACQTVNSEAVEIHSLLPLELVQIGTHQSDPQVILGFTQAIYGKCPQAWLVVVPGINFEFGECFSPTAERGISQALIQIKNLLSENLVRNRCTK